MGLRIMLDDKWGPLNPLLPEDLRYWTPTLGPTCSLLLPQLIRAGLDGAGVDLAEVGFLIGVKRGEVLAKSITRLSRFWLLSTNEDVLIVRRYLPVITYTSLSEAPEWWQRGYRERVGDQRAAATS